VGRKVTVPEYDYPIRISGFRHRGRKFVGLNGALKIASVVAAVAERFLLGVAATTEAEGGATGKAIGLAGGVEQFELARKQQWAVVLDTDFRRHANLQGHFAR
jgi:hypothetical protein